MAGSTSPSQPSEPMLAPGPFRASISLGRQKRPLRAPPARRSMQRRRPRSHHLWGRAYAVPAPSALQPLPPYRPPGRTPPVFIPRSVRSDPSLLVCKLKRVPTFYGTTMASCDGLPSVLSAWRPRHGIRQTMRIAMTTCPRLFRPIRQRTAEILARDTREQWLGAACVMHRWRSLAADLSRDPDAIGHSGPKGDQPARGDWANVS
jgi:hypothetical protein